METGRAGSRKKPERARTALRSPVLQVQFGHVTSFVALWLLVLAIPARADVRILASPGGEVGSYIKLFSVLRQSGQRVIVDGLVRVGNWRDASLPRFEQLPPPFCPRLSGHSG